ncbi:MAG: sulfatase-like hydrolase/transferase, partial [Gammaproteobacteria bacterium]
MLNRMIIGAPILLILLTVFTASVSAKEIVFDAEFQKVQKQYGAAWAEEDKQLNKRLAELKAKHGKSPNIIYFMWDDAAYGRVGHPMLSKLTGIDTPNIDKMAQEGMTLTRMYTEPSCTPTRVATLTGRHPVRSGLTQVVF